MKRFLMTGLILVSIGMFVLSGCGSSTSDSTPAEPTYQNSDLLVTGSWLAANIDNTNQVIIDVRSSTDYNAGHIKNAINSTPGSFDKGGTGIDSTDLKTASEIATALGNAGVSNSAKIIVYGKNVDSNAGRVFWILEYLGATDVHVLDGGYDKWVSDGRATVTTATTLVATTFTPTVDDTRLATKAEVLAHYPDTTNYAIVDSRNAPDYNTRHIPNAVNILTGDLLNADNTVKSYTDLKTFLDGKGVTAGKTVISHCYVGYRSGQEYFILRLMGFNVSNYDGSTTEWFADSSLETVSELPVSGSWLATNIDNQNQVIIDTRSSSDYTAGHIKNAINLTPGSFDIGGSGTDSTDLKPAADIATALGAAGVSNSVKIIVYGADVDANAGRMFWVLEYLGAADVRILDGGYSKWVSDGRATVTTASTLPATTFTPTVKSAKLATKADVLAHYADTTNYAIVDSRFAADYNLSHIPNAVNILMSDLLNADKTVKSYSDLRTLLDGKGVTAGKTVITHCYVGYMSAQEYFIFRLMGFTVSNYDGSFTEWSADPTDPVTP